MAQHFKFKILKPFAPLYKGELKAYRELFYYGGRGGGKTSQLVQYCLIKCIESQTKVLCLRKYDKSQKYSLISAFRDLIQTLDLESSENEYILKNESALGGLAQLKIREIDFINGSKIIFSGVNDNTIWSLKSFSNINIAFYDEANEITKKVYDVLKPTIRAANSQLIFSFNPLYEKDFISQKVLSLQDNDTYSYKCKINYYDNALFPAVMERDRLESFQNDTREIYNWIWEGEFLKEKAGVINTSNIATFDNSLEYQYTKIFITMDTAYTKTNHSDYSVIALFGIYKDCLHILRIMRGQWEFGELSQNLKYMYNFAIEKYKKQVAPIIIEEKSSGISLIQELKKLTHFNIKSVKPTTDKFTRLSKVLYLFDKLRIPLHKSELDSWVDIMLSEMQEFQADLKHEHDDIVDCVIYALDYYVAQNSQISYKDLVKTLKI